MSCVYLLKSHNSKLFKIGVTRNSVEKRIKELQTGSAKKIILQNYYNSENSFGIESLLHKKYSHLKQEYDLESKTKLYGEWFFFDNEEELEFLKMCKIYDDYINIKNSL